MRNPKLTLREQVNEVMRFKHYSQRTEATYWQWIERYLRHARSNPSSGPPCWRHPRDLGAPKVRDFLGYLATHCRVAAGTQNQALNALVFHYREVLHQPLGELGEWMGIRALRSIRGFKVRLCASAPPREILSLCVVVELRAER